MCIRDSHQGSRKRTGRKRVGVRGYLQQERGYVYQRVYRGIAQGRAHGLHPLSLIHISPAGMGPDVCKRLAVSG